MKNTRLARCYTLVFENGIASWKVKLRAEILTTHIFSQVEKKSTSSPGTASYILMINFSMVEVKQTHLKSWWEATTVSVHMKELVFHI